MPSVSCLIVECRQLPLVDRDLKRVYVKSIVSKRFDRSEVTYTRVSPSLTVCDLSQT